MTTFDIAAFRIACAAAGTALGEPLVAVAETGSTNDDAFAAAKAGAPHGATFVADTQTHGRGRRGNVWTSPPGENLTFSVLLRPTLPAEKTSAIALVAGLAVRSAAAGRIGEALGVKWPNDVLCGKRKLAGILVESRLRGSEIEAVVVGIGVNVFMRDLPPDIAALATSLALLGDPAPSREALLATILAGLETRLERYTDEGLSALLPELEEHDALRDKPLKVGAVHGVGAGIDADGALLLRDATGRVHRVTSGTVEFDL